MRISTVSALLAGVAVAVPLPVPQLGGLLGVGNTDAIAQLEEAFNRDNPNGTPAAPGDPADLNGDGVINLFEAGAQVSKRAATCSGADNDDIIAQLQDTFDRDNPNGTPAAPGDPDDLNGDGVINVFEAGAQAGKRAVGCSDGGDVISQLQDSFNRDNPNGTPTAPGDPDDLNGDGVINFFEAGAQAS